MVHSFLPWNFWARKMCSSFVSGTDIRISRLPLVVSTWTLTWETRKSSLGSLTRGSRPERFFKCKVVVSHT